MNPVSVIHTLCWSNLGGHFVVSNEKKRKSESSRKSHQMVNDASSTVLVFISDRKPAKMSYIAIKI